MLLCSWDSQPETASWSYVSKCFLAKSESHSQRCRLHRYPTLVIRVVAQKVGNRIECSAPHEGVQNYISHLQGESRIHQVIGKAELNPVSTSPVEVLPRCRKGCMNNRAKERDKVKQEQVCICRPVIWVCSGREESWVPVPLPILFMHFIQCYFNAKCICSL